MTKSPKVIDAYNEWCKKNCSKYEKFFVYSSDSVFMVKKTIKGSVTYNIK